MAKKYKKNKETIGLPEAKKMLSDRIQKLGLNDRELKFVAVYCSSGFSPRQAHKKAGYRAKNDRYRDISAQHVLNRPKIKEAIALFIDEAIEPVKDFVEYRIIRVYMLRAFYNLNWFYDEDGEIRPLPEIDDDLQVVIDGVNTRYYGKDASTKVIEYKIADRDTALRQLLQLIEKSELLKKQADTVKDRKKAGNQSKKSTELDINKMWKEQEKKYNKIYGLKSKNKKDSK